MCNKHVLNVNEALLSYVRFIILNRGWWMSSWFHDCWFGNLWLLIMKLHWLLSWIVSTKVKTATDVDFIHSEEDFICYFILNTNTLSPYHLRQWSCLVFSSHTIADSGNRKLVHHPCPPKTHGYGWAWAWVWAPNVGLLCRARHINHKPQFK